MSIEIKESDDHVEYTKYDDKTGEWISKVKLDKTPGVPIDIENLKNEHYEKPEIINEGFDNFAKGSYECLECIYTIIELGKPSIFGCNECKMREYVKNKYNK